MDSIVVYSSFMSPRLSYTLQWLLKERLQLDYTITNTLPAEVAEGAHVIAYGTVVQGAICIPAAGLLSQTGTAALSPQVGSWQDIPALFFADTTDGYTLPFDLLSAIFYLISRYEEYDSYTPDKHGRYPAQNSILYRNGWMSRPVADEWVAAFRWLIEEAWDISVPAAHFVYRPTYDIDMAYSHLHKGLRRIAGAYIRALLRVDVRQISQRTRVLKKKQKDPYDSFRWLRQLHKEYGFVPLYFVLSALRTTRFDKNIHPHHPAMVRVIKNLVRDGAIGIHPSYYCNEANLMQAEKSSLEQVAGRTTMLSRQHYIRMVMPQTYRWLVQHHISDDYSMGYGTHLGFRAGTGSSFLWYDLENESATGLRIHPFCFMDTTAHYEAGLSASQAFDQLAAMCRILQETNSTLITIFHNFSLGTDEEWKGWREAYENFMQDRSVAARMPAPDLR